MLVIRSETMEELKELTRNKFVNRMIHHLKHFFPNSLDVKSDRKLRDLIHEGIYKANSYNMTRECDVARFIDLMVAIHPNFDFNPQTVWTHEILKDLSLTADNRLNKIIHQLRTSNVEA